MRDRPQRVNTGRTRQWQQTISLLMERVIAGDKPLRATRCQKRLQGDKPAHASPTDAKRSQRAIGMGNFLGNKTASKI
jgi:hypothetical protein